MPELPEVETVVRGLRAPLIGRRIESLWYDQPRSLRGLPPDEMTARIAGQTVRGIERRAKYIVCQLDDDLLVVHLKMTGRLYVVPDDAVHEADRWVRVRLQLDEGKQLRFSDARRFGFVALVTDLAQIAPHLGPEPLDDSFTLEALAAGLRGHHRAIKGLLLDQSVIAGVGNIYADEALHRAGIHPLTPADSLTVEQVQHLHRAIRDALTAGIEAEGASVNWYRKPDGTSGSAQKSFLVYDRTGEACHTCGTPIAKIRVAQRGTHFCPTCQPLPVAHAARA